MDNMGADLGTFKALELIGMGGWRRGGGLNF